jgi:hypothetical protein
MKPRLTLQEKIDRDMPLNKRELMAATGYGWRALGRINPPFVCGKIRLSDFEWHTYYRAGIYESKEAGASPEPSNDLRSIADSMRAPRKSNDQPDASPYRVGLPPRSNG